MSSNLPAPPMGMSRANWERFLRQNNFRQQGSGGSIERGPQPNRDVPTQNPIDRYADQHGYGWLTGNLLSKFGELWDETGDPNAALARLRDTGIYEKTFRGIKRDDGTLRMDESEYKSFQVGVQSMADELGFRVKPNQFVNMVQNEVNPQEFARAASEAYQRFVEPGVDKDNGLTQMFVNQFADSGSAVAALETVRDSDRYDKVFAGNIREDGTIRMEENEYFAYKRGFEKAFLSRGLNPRPFEAKGRLRDVVEAELSIQEVEGRLNAVEQGVLGNSRETLEFFTSNYGEDGINFLSQRGDRATALAMAVDPDIGKDILSRRISASQIGGEAALQGFRRSLNRAEKLARAGVNQGQAREFFGMAAQSLAGIGATTERFRRGGTNLGQLEDAFLLGQGDEQQRIGRALEAEQSSFSGRMDVRRDRETGGLSGLRQR